MSLGLLAGTVLAMLAVMAAVLVGLTYLFARRGKSVPPLPFYVGGVALLLVTAALVGRSEFVSHSPHFVRSGLDVAAWLGASFFLFTVLDALIIGEWLIERGTAVHSRYRSAAAHRHGSGRRRSLDPLAGHGD
jgi:Na+/citrate or Na+/malate symporter